MNSAAIYKVLKNLKARFEPTTTKFIQFKIGIAQPSIQRLDCGPIK
jgi:hypothetical protein